MRSRRPKPFQAPLRKDPLVYDRQVKAWAKRLLAGVDVDPDDPAHRAELEFVLTEVTQRRRASGTTAATTLQQRIQASFLKHLERYHPVCAAPELDDELEDLRLVLEMPRLQQLWCEWPDPPRGRSGPKPHYACAKAVLIVFGWTEAGDLEEAYNRLTHRAQLRVLFESLERMREGRAVPHLPGLGASAAELKMASYPTVARQLPLVAETLMPLVDACRVDLLRELVGYFPDAPIGEVLSIDGTDHPLWIPQRGYKEDDEREQKLRERVPNARFRAWGDDSKGAGGKRELGREDKVTVTGFKKKWRGTYELPLCDLVTGMPVVRRSQTENEHFGLVPLLSDLYRLWPDVGLQIVTGDSAFDQAISHRLLVVNYGVQGCFPLHDKRGDRQFPPGASKNGSVWGTDPNGRLYCGICRKPMDLNEQSLFPRRYRVDGKVQVDEHGNSRNLYAGVENEPDKHRVRATCADHGRPGVSMSANWKLLGGLPHYPEGRPDLYGKRLAIMARRSMSETYNSRLKTARRMCTPGPDRTRHNDPRTLNALLEIAALSFVAQQVYDERRQRGISGRFGLPATGKTPPAALAVGAPHVAA
ncbi:hypothetical protein [Paraconexibacter algicola]|uniref:Transposase n=1 Tax=Paraconexibacter algicola TaxID=2133960 RepID=A0A2T4UEK2_9ACTN|nr:hypothetical protein [Paraconexibacter algicola]PTL56142.1 hypothetical protein C7Y72_14205 [Paraconexibacter algicola]